MRFDADPVAEEADYAADADSPSRGGSHMVSLHFLRGALRRRRAVWIGLALVGLVGGVAYHVVVPVQYSATTTLYVSDTPGSNQTVASANDLAMLATPAVGRRAANLLGEPGLSPSKLLGKAPGTAVSDNVIVISVSGPTSSEAVRRANAVATAYLAFRAEQYQRQSDAVVNAAQGQIAQLQAEIGTLSAQIAAAVTGGQSADLASQRAAATAQLTNLQQSVQTEKFDALTVTKGSRVIATAVPGGTSRKKVLLLDGLTGMAVGLALGLGIVVLQAVLSDRLRRREDVASVLGAPVTVSVGRLGRRRLRYRLPLGSLRSLAASPDHPLLTLVRFLRSRIAAGDGRPGVLVVPVDDPGIPAAGLVTLARRLGTDGKRVALVDATARHDLGRLLGVSGEGPHVVTAGDGAPATCHLLPKPWEAERQGLDGRDRSALAEADVVLVLATVDPAVGAWHLRTWATEAVVTVGAGRATARQIDAVVQLLAAAGIAVGSAALLGADPDDVSVGLPEQGGPALRPPEGSLAPDAALLA